MADHHGNIGGLIALDTSFTLEMIDERGVYSSVLCRDLDGFFTHVWSVHPFASMLTSRIWSTEFGTFTSHELNPRHTFIEGKVGRWLWLRNWFACNFLISQATLLIRLAILIRREEVRVIRAGDPLYCGLFGWILSRLTGVPLVIRVGSNNDKIRQTTGQPIYRRLFRSASLEKWIERFILRHADLVVGANEDNLQFAIANGADPAVSTVFRYGNLIAKDHLIPREERTIDNALMDSLGIKPDGFVLCIARLEPVKLPDHVVRVLASIRSQGHDVKLVIVGDGQMGDELKNLARELGVHNSLVLPGNRSQEILAQLIAAAAAVVSPHTGRALAEAAYGAAPIVAYDIDWQSEVIENGETGELVPFGDVEAMSEAAGRLLSDRERARRLGDAALRRAHEILDPARLDEHERATYRALFARGESKKH